MSAIPAIMGIFTTMDLLLISVFSLISGKFEGKLAVCRVKSVDLAVGEVSKSSNERACFALHSAVFLPG
jgi:hypothetical protein